MARNPHAQRPRSPRWPTCFRTTLNLSLLEHSLLRRYAAREGLALGAAARELIDAALILEAVADPTRDEWSETIARVRRRDPETALEAFARIRAELGIGQ